MAKEATTEKLQLDESSWERFSSLEDHIYEGVPGIVYQEKPDLADEDIPYYVAAQLLYFKERNSQ